MKKTLTTIALSAFLFSSHVFAQKTGQVKILFDCTHSESAGNGDWVIDSDLENLDWNPNAKTGTGGSYDHANPQQYPTPTQTTVTSSTAETYWQGALSYWAIDCVNYGYWVETLPPLTGKITYGVSTNAQDLSNYNIFVVDEPNIIFTAAEKTALMNFIKNGGSLFAISDHTNSDRNNDGKDSPAIWNDFLTNNGVANNAFGYIFSLQDFSGTSTNVATSSNDSIIHGKYGNVAEVQWSDGTSMNINPTQNAAVQAHVWKSGITKGDTGVLCVTSRYGCGKIASISDSSPPEDGTGNPAVTTYTGYTGDAKGNHRPWLMNMMIWLAYPGNCKTNTTGINSIAESKDITIFPNPSNDILNINLENLEGIKEVKLYDLSGRLMMEKNTEANLLQLNILQIDNGSYFLQVRDENGMFANKQVLIFK